MDELAALRREISALDTQILDLFSRRMAAVERVAEYKIREQKPIHVPSREGEILAGARNQLPKGLEGYGEVLVRTMLRLSRERQYELFLEEEGAVMSGELAAVEGSGQGVLTLELDADPKAVAFVVDLFTDLGIAINRLECLAKDSVRQRFLLEFSIDRGGSLVQRALYQLEQETTNLQLLSWHADAQP